MSIIVTYSGVHQAFLHAGAASQAGELESFLCSLYDAPGKWGRRLSKVLGASALVNRSSPDIAPSKVVEFPWPMIKHRLNQRLLPRFAGDWLAANEKFDSWSARKILNSNARLVVATETCARDSIKAARERGALSLLDCPQVHPDFLTSLFASAGQDLECDVPMKFDTPAMDARKREEFKSADHLLTISQIQANSFIEAGIPESKISTISLGIDSDFWRGGKHFQKQSGPLRILFVGGICLRKGIPYLLKAVEMLGNQAELWLVGPNSGEVDNFLSNASVSIKFLGRKNKIELRDLYRAADVFVLPSLIDTFGFVGMEAMAAGTPTIVTDNCGVPVPDSSWRVPVMNADALASRLTEYIINPRLLADHSEKASLFAKSHNRQWYQDQVSQLFGHLMEQ
ncbi:glycosyltransferase family 4 protein [Puniceicoccaceae bacterium K14]|nr:glycosyltransferase family 4 protein [Puniceicoccaceae bacterium K14]